MISENILKSDSNIIDSFQLIDKLNGLQIDLDYVLISLDVISLFTNVPIELAVESISNRWEHISKNCDPQKRSSLERFDLS